MTEVPKPSVVYKENQVEILQVKKSVRGLIIQG